MVNLTLRDYRLLLSWFELAFARLDKTKISSEDKKVFWKLTFLAEDKLEEEKRREEEEE
jgi:hypothetical protein|tara:strand:- start:42 stop:218 length:177 start_codon:yes stop_codon:yes gene_type:complete